MNDEHFEKLSNTRNYYTHFNDYLSTLILSNAELVTVNNRLASYLKVLLLSVLGATDEELRTITAERFVFKDFYKDQPAQIG